MDGVTDDEEIAKYLNNEMQKLGVDLTTEGGRRDFRETMQWARTNKARCDKFAGYIMMIDCGPDVLGEMPR